MRWALFMIAMAAPISAQANDVGQLVRFVSCPIYRDTDAGRKSGCWLADDRETGMRWDVTQSPHKPDWNFAILVEGRVSGEGGNPCGARILDPVRTSILPDRCPRHILPPEDYTGRKFTLPRRNNSPVGSPRMKMAGPFAERTFNIYFEFDRDFMIYQYSDWLIDQAASWIESAKPKHIIVTGFAATKPVTVSGSEYAESATIAKSRAEMVSETLLRLQPTLSIETRWETDSEAIDDPEADGLPDQSKRRVEILVLFK